MKTTQYLAQSAARAAIAPGHLIGGATSALLSVATLNPLPLIFFGVGSAYWMYHALSSGRYNTELYAREKAEVAAKQEADRAKLCSEVNAILSDPPFTWWRETAQLPDYIAQYQQLLEIRDSVSSMVERRPDFTRDMEREIVVQMNVMLDVYLRLVRSRTIYMHLLNETFPVPVRIPASEVTTGSALKRLFLIREQPDQIVWRPPTNVTQKRTMRSFAERMQKLERSIGELQKSLAQHPEAVRERQSHIELLEQQKALLERCDACDQRIIAQLDMIPDFFKVIQSKAGAVEFTASEFGEYMREVVDQAEAAARFADEIRAEFDQISGGVPLATLEST